MTSFAPGNHSPHRTGAVALPQARSSFANEYTQCPRPFWCGERSSRCSTSRRVLSQQPSLPFVSPLSGLRTATPGETFPLAFFKTSAGFNPRSRFGLPRTSSTVANSPVATLPTRKTRLIQYTARASSSPRSALYGWIRYFPACDRASHPACGIRSSDSTPPDAMLQARSQVARHPTNADPACGRTPPRYPPRLARFRRVLVA